MAAPLFRQILLQLLITVSIGIEKTKINELRLPIAHLKTTLFKKWAIPGLFFVYFRLFKQTLIFLQQMNMKNVRPAYGAGI